MLKALGHDKFFEAQMMLEMHLNSMSDQEMDELTDRIQGFIESKVAVSE